MLLKRYGFEGEISKKLPNGWFGIKIYNIREFC